MLPLGGKADVDQPLINNLDLRVHDVARRKRKAAPKDRFTAIVSELKRLRRERCFPLLAGEQT
jgi:hypothetical protein